MTRMKVLAAGLSRSLARILRTNWKWLPLSGLLVLAAITISCSMMNCDQPSSSTPTQVITNTRGVPLIRVKLTPKPAEPVIATTGGYNLYCDGRLVAQSPSPLPAVTVNRVGGTWNIGNQSFAGGTCELQVAPNTLVRYGPASASYRGNLRLVPTPEGQYAVVNVLDIESYLAGVLAKELRTNWADETYKALAVAARTFARYQSITFGQNSYYDVTDDQASQVYGGYPAETPRSRQAVADTFGEVLVAKAPGGNEGLFLAQYSACCGGKVNSAAVIRNCEPLAPLQGGEVCEDCAACPRYRWNPVKILKTDMFRALCATYPESAGLGNVTDVRVASYTPYGRALWLDVVGNPGSRPLRVRADDLRLSLLRYKNSSGTSPASTIYSMNCSLRSVGDSIEFYDGKGFGHGVGLCQWGAQGKAEKGWNAMAILNFYYPGARVIRAYSPA